MKAGKTAIKTSDLVGHAAEEHEPVGHGQHIGIGEVDFELADAVFVVEGINIPAKLVHGLHQIADPVQIVEQPGHIVSWLGQMVARADRPVTAFVVFLEDEELGLDAHVHADTPCPRPG